MPDPPAACRRYEQMAEMLRAELRRPGVSAAVFTAWTDVEDEIDGVMTYDRRAFKCDPEVIRAENQATVAASRAPASLRAEPPAIPTGEVAYWPFDDGAGDVAHDASGNGHDLTLRNGAGWGAGVHGGSLSVAGDGQAAQIDLPLFDSRQDFTIGAWVRTADPTRGGTVVGLEGTVTNGFSLRLQGGRWAFAMPERDVPLNPAASGIACPLIEECLASASNRYMGLEGDARDNVVAGEWYYLVGVHDRATDSIVLYTDGDPVDSRWLGDTFSAPGPFSIGAGRTAGGTPDSFDGQIDDLRVWNRALSSPEVSELFSAEAPG
jgi:Concanavalin A-like lectin/glucanases superfamily